MKLGNDKIAEAIKTLRWDLDMSQTEFAEACKTSRISVYYWETGRYRPSKKYLNNLKKHLLATSLRREEMLSEVEKILNSFVLKEGRKRKRKPKGENYGN